MVQSSTAKIYLSEERGLSQRNGFRSYHTFNAGEYFNEHKHAYGNLYLLNDETLAGKSSVQITVSENSLIILLPVVGSIICKDNLGNEQIINAGEMQCYHAASGVVMTILNPYDEELVNFLRIGIKVPVPPASAIPELFSFSLDGSRNELIDINPIHFPANSIVSIGKFDGRSEAFYKLKNKGVFVFVIQGVFEAEGRLLQQRDGLSISGTAQVEFEALSNDAIILLLPINA